MSTNIYITRHLQRIDDTDSAISVNAVKWNKIYSKNSQFFNNPYLVDKAFSTININNVIKNFKNRTESGENLAKEIDIIITSPFLRCLETSILLRDKINKLKKEANKLKEEANKSDYIDHIEINYGLSEIIVPELFTNVNEGEGGSLNIDDIWKFSKKYLICNCNQRALNQYVTEGFETSDYTIPDMNPNIFRHSVENETKKNILWETDDMYNDRICSTILQISKTYEGKNILIITHADAGKIKNIDYYKIKLGPPHYNREIKKMVYESSCIPFRGKMEYKDVLKVIKITYGIDTTELEHIENIDGKNKYLKYKNKYLNLKYKNRL